MCLGIPGKIIKLLPDKAAQADFGGVTRIIQLDLIKKAKVGEFVMVHAGFAIERLTNKDALETLKILKDACIDVR